MRTRRALNERLNFLLLFSPYRGGERSIAKEGEENLLVLQRIPDTQKGKETKE
jgi:hypothetical protein